MAAEDEPQPQQPMLEDASPTPVAVGSGATSDGERPDDGGVSDQSSSDSSSSEEERPPIIAKIVTHRGTKGQPEDPVLLYYTIQYARLGEEKISSLHTTIHDHSARIREHPRGLTLPGRRSDRQSSVKRLRREEPTVKLDGSTWAAHRRRTAWGHSALVLHTSTRRAKIERSQPMHGRE
jgi:hypothetical protein